MLINRVISKFNRRLACVMMAAVFALATSATGFADEVAEGIKERIAPAGSVCMSGDDCAAAPVAAAPSGPRTGEAIYKASCTTCHAIGVSGAPRLGNADDWAPRIAADKLFENAWNGLNAMPAKGLCMDCSEDEIKATITYMVENSQ